MVWPSFSNLRRSDVAGTLDAGSGAVFNAYHEMMDDILSPSQCQAARAVLEWHQDDLARASDVSKKTIQYFERGNHTPKRATLRILRYTLQEAGIVFLDPDADGRSGIMWPSELGRRVPWTKAAV